MQRFLQSAPFLSDPITRLSGLEFNSIFLDLKGYVAESQNLLREAASILDNAWFNQEEFEACSDFVLDLVFTKALCLVIDYCSLEKNVRLSNLENMHASFPIEHVVSVLNGFYEASEWIKLGCPVNDFQQTCFHVRSPKLLRASGAFDRAWKEGSRIVARVMGAHVHPLIQMVGEESWLEGSVTKHWQHDVCHYYDKLKTWMVPDVFRKFFADTFDGYLRCYVKALLSAKERLPELNIDHTFFVRAYADLGVIQDILMKYVEKEEKEKVHARMNVMITFVRMLACDYDDVRMVIQDFMSLATSTNINVGILEKVASSLISAFVGVSNASADTQIS